jgi:hypothetical protein
VRRHYSVALGALLFVVASIPARAETDLTGKWVGQFNGVQIELPPERGPSASFRRRSGLLGCDADEGLRGRQRAIEAHGRPSNQHVATVDNNDLARAKTLLHQVKIRLSNVACLSNPSYGHLGIQRIQRTLTLLRLGYPLQSRQPKIVATVHQGLIALAQGRRVFADSSLIHDHMASRALRLQVPGVIETRRGSRRIAIPAQTLVRDIFVHLAFDSQTKGGPVKHRTVPEH